MKIGIKYCGGCNPIYDRAAVVSSLEEYVNKAYNIEIAKQGIIYAVVIILCGCTSACASNNNLKAKYGKVCITSGNDNSKLFDIIDKMNVLSLGE